MESVERRVRFVDDVGLLKAAAKQADFKSSLAFSVKEPIFDPHPKKCIDENDQIAFVRLKTTSNLVEEENLNPKEKREMYEKGWRNLECSTSEKAFDQDDDSPEAQDDLFFQHIPHPKSEQGIQVVNSYNPSYWVQESRTLPHSFLGVFNGVCIPCLLIGGEPRLPLEYFRKWVLAARGDQGSWDNLNDAIARLNIMVREASPIEVISLKKIGKKLLHKEQYFTIITRTDAERIYALLYSKYSSKPLTKGSKRRALFVRDENKTWDMSERIPIQHSGIIGDLDEQDSFQTKDTLSRPAVYGWLFPSRASRRCIICEKCHRKFTIFDFCTHGHYSEKAQETRNRVNKWGFNSCNWFNHIRIAEPFDHVLAYQQFWTDFLSLHLEPKCGTKRRQNLDATLEIQERQSTVAGAEKENWDKHKVGFKVARVKQESLWPTYNYGKHWGFRECPNKSLISEYQKLTCNTSTIKLKALWLLAAKEVAYIQMVLADASRGHVLGFDPKAPPSPEQFNNMLPLPAKPTDFARPEDLLNGQSGSGDYEEKAEMERELEEIEALLESKNGEEKSKCLEKIKNLKSKYSILQHKTDIVKREYDRIYRNYGLLHATYQTAMDPTTHLDAHVQKQYDIIKEEQRALKSTTITKTDSKDSDGPPVLVAMTTPPGPSTSQEDVIEIVQPSQQTINMKRPYIHKPILQIGEEQRTAILAQEKAAKYMEKYARTIDQNVLARTRMRKHDNAAPRLSAGTSPSFQIPNLSGFKPHQSVQLQQPSSKKHKLFPHHMSPASSSSNVPGQNQPQNQAPSPHVAAAIVGQKQSFLQQAPSPQIGSSKFTHPLLNTVNDQIHQQQQQQQQQQPQQNVLQLHHLLGLVPGPSSSSLSAPALSAAPIQIQVPSIQINHPVSHNQPSSAFVPTNIQVPQPQQPVQITSNENPYAQLAASLTPQQLQLQIEATQRILQANQQSSSQPPQAVYTLPASIIQQQPPSLVPSLPQSAVSLQSLFPQLQSSNPNPISLSVSGVSSHSTPGQLTLPLANRDQELNLGSTVSINLLDSLLRQQRSSSNGNNS